MKVSLIAISIIIALQATSFIHGSQQRYNYHHTLNQISQSIKTFQGPNPATDCSCLCYHFSEEVRFGIIAFMYGAALLMLTGESVFPAFLAQALWIVLQGYLCTEKTLPNIRNLAVQLLILFVLASNTKCFGGDSKCSTLSSKKSVQQYEVEKEQTSSQQETKAAQSKIKKQEKPQKESNNNKESLAKAKSKKSN